MSGFVVGVSGGIGSGKSTVAEQFFRRGAAVIDTDHLAHALTASGGAAMSAIRAAFGDGVITTEGALDRAAMRQRVFANPDERQKLERILHPMIRDEASRSCAAADSTYALLLIPLLAETLAASPYRFLDRILIVDCDEATQIARVVRRSGMPEAEVRAIMATQASRATRQAIADDLLENSGELAALEGRIDALHNKYLALAAAKVNASC